MNLKLYALALGLLSCTALNMQVDARDCSSSSSDSCSSYEGSAFFSAKGITPFTLEAGGPSSPFSPIPFQFDIIVEGQGIAVASASSVQLDEGFYLISYSGSSNITLQAGSSVFFEYALHLDNAPQFVFSDSSELGYDYIRLSSFTTVVWAPANAVLSIQARTISPSSQGEINNRSLVIQRLK
jgi:hypothetical protein